MALFAWWFFFILIGALIGQSRGRVGSGVIWSLLLGPFGWLITAMLSDLRSHCPCCFGAVDGEATRCRHCGVAFADLVVKENLPTSENP